MKTAKLGRPSAFSEKLATEICDRLTEGETLRTICADPCMPAHPTVLLWVKENYGVDENGRNGLSDRYARAREAGCEKIAEEIITISDADYTGPDGFVDNAAVQQARLKSDNRKWLLSKMFPRKYGDRVTQELVGDSDRPLIQRIELVAVIPQHRLPKPEDETAITQAAVMPLRAVTAR